MNEKKQFCPTFFDAGIINSGECQKVDSMQKQSKNYVPRELLGERPNGHSVMGIRNMTRRLILLKTVKC